jgi:cytoskeletal protein CcmA (bactofilin family)
MWKKPEDEVPSMPPPPQQPTYEPKSEPKREVATIGASISLSGELAGEEDLLIQGRLDGKVSLEKNNITVGKSGRVKADIFGKSIRVDGEVEGNLFGGEEVVIRQSGKVHGNIVSPRVTLENGAKFKGNIDMEPDRAPMKLQDASRPTAVDRVAPAPPKAAANQAGAAAPRN